MYKSPKERDCFLLPGSGPFSLEKVDLKMGKERGPFKAEGPASHPTLSGSQSPVHDDVHVAAVPLEAGAQQDVVPPAKAHLHGEVGHHLGVGLQHGLQLEQGLLGLLSALSPGRQTQSLVRDLCEPSHEAVHGLPAEWGLRLARPYLGTGSQLLRTPIRRGFSQSPPHGSRACECGPGGLPTAPGSVPRPRPIRGSLQVSAHSPGLLFFRQRKVTLILRLLLCLLFPPGESAGSSP